MLEAACIFLMIAQPLIMGYVAQKHFQQIGVRSGLFIFWTIVAAILSWTIGLQIEKAVRNPYIRRSDLEQIATVLIAIGVSSAIVLVILTILRKKQV